MKNNFILISICLFGFNSYADNINSSKDYKNDEYYKKIQEQASTLEKKIALLHKELEKQQLSFKEQKNQLEKKINSNSNKNVQEKYTAKDTEAMSSSIFFPGGAPNNVNQADNVGMAYRENNSLGLAKDSDKPKSTIENKENSNTSNSNDIDSSSISTSENSTNSQNNIPLPPSNTDDRYTITFLTSSETYISFSYLTTNGVPLFSFNDGFSITQEAENDKYNLTSLKLCDSNYTNCSGVVEPSSGVFTISHNFLQNASLNGFIGSVKNSSSFYIPILYIASEDSNNVEHRYLINFPNNNDIIHCESDDSNKETASCKLTQNNYKITFEL